MFMVLSFTSCRHASMREANRMPSGAQSGGSVRGTSLRDSASLRYNGFARRRPRKIRPRRWYSPAGTGRMIDSPETRASLLVRIRDGRDTEAWQQFIQLYAPLVYGFARRRGLQDADAADLMQEVLRSVAAAAGR